MMKYGFSEQLESKLKEDFLWQIVARKVKKKFSSFGSTLTRNDNMAKRFGPKLIKLVTKLEEDGSQLNSSCTIECFEIGKQKEPGFRYAVKIWGMIDGPHSFIYDGTWREASDIQAPSEIRIT